MKKRANARERQLGKFFLPGFLQMFAVARRNGKEKFVVFAVGDGVVDPGAGTERQALHVDLETDLARMREPRKVGTEAIAQIDHGVNGELLRKPARFFDARDKAQMFAALRSAESAGYEKIVACFSATARDPARLLNE